MATIDRAGQWLGPRSGAALVALGVVAAMTTGCGGTQGGPGATTAQSGQARAAQALPSWRHGAADDGRSSASGHRVSPARGAAVVASPRRRARGGTRPAASGRSRRSALAARRPRSRHLSRKSPSHEAEGEGGAHSAPGRRPADQKGATETSAVAEPREASTPAPPPADESTLTAAGRASSEPEPPPAGGSTLSP